MVTRPNVPTFGTGGDRRPVTNGTMYTVYILQDKNNKLYKGLTNNLERRIREHKEGKTKTTRRMADLKLIYKEEYDNFAEARKRELYFKSAAGRRFLKNKLNMES